VSGPDSDPASTTATKHLSQSVCKSLAGIAGILYSLIE
jgi:hypothetical protein